MTKILNVNLIIFRLLGFRASDPLFVPVCAAQRRASISSRIVFAKVCPILAAEKLARCIM